MAPTDTADERALIDDVPFSVPSDMRDIVAVSLVLANRYVDLEGNDPDDLDKLVVVHGDPQNQANHCLRGPNQDEPNGSESAVSDCREIIRGKALGSAAGLNSDGSIDRSARSGLDVFLEIRGTVEASLPTYAVQMGQALHTFQDAFSHHFRTEDHRQIKTVLNYIDLVDNQLVPERDGPAHSSILDECSSLDGFRKERVQTAARASAELMLASLEASDTEREAAVDKVLDRYLTLEQACTFENDWCGAAELGYSDSGGCSIQRLSRQRSPGWALMLLPLAVAMRRGARERGRRGSDRCRPAFASRKLLRKRQGLLLWVLASCVLLASPARANEPTPEQRADAAQEVAPVNADTVNADGELSPGDTKTPLGVNLFFAAAFSDPALAGTVGARYRFNEHWLVGLDGEWNPLISSSSGTVRTGLLNVYANLIIRFPLTFEKVNLRSTYQAGMSRMLFDLYGAPEGSTGLYFGFNLLGLDYELYRQVYLILDPASIAIPIPKLDQLPFYYPQYRVKVGLQWGA